MESVQSNGAQEMLRAMTQQSLNTLSETAAGSESGKTDSSEFQKLMEQQTKATNGSDAEQTAASQTETTEATETDEQDAQQRLESEQALMQQLIAAGMMNFTPVVENETVTVEETTLNVETSEVVLPQTDAPAVEAAASEVLTEVAQAEQSEQSTQTVPTVHSTQSGEEVTAAQEQSEPLVVHTQEQSPMEDSSEQGQAQLSERQAETPTQTETAEHKDELDFTAAGENVQPLFEQVDEIPIKVGETTLPTQTTETENVTKQVEVKLLDALERGESRLELQLQPANLGTVKVELTRSADGTLSVVLSAERSHTGSLLAKHSADLQSMLLANGQEKVHVEVQTTQQNEQPPQQDLADGHNGEQHQQQQQQSRQDPENASDFLQQLRLGLIETDET